MIGTARIALWLAWTASTIALSGLDWAMASVEIPIAWVLVLTFIPTSDLIDTTTAQLDKLQTDDSRQG